MPFIEYDWLCHCTQLLETNTGELMNVAWLILAIYCNVWSSDFPPLKSLKVIQNAYLLKPSIARVMSRNHFCPFLSLGLLKINFINPHF